MIRKVISIVVIFILKILNLILKKDIKVSWNSEIDPRCILRVLKKRNIIIGRTKITRSLEFNDGVKILKGVILSGEIKIGNYTSVNGPGTILAAGINKINIGNFCSIAPGVKVQEIYHKYNRVTSYSICNNIFNEKTNKNDVYSKGEINIKDDVWIGANSIILSGVTIGRGSIIGAGSIVTKDIPPYSIAVGNPAKIIRKRFSEKKIKKLEKSEWWLWDTEKINKNKDFFLKELN